MKKFNFFLFSCFLATCMCLAVGCSKDDDPNDPDNSVPDPAGTVTVNIAENAGIDIQGYSYSVIRWHSPDNFYLAGGYYYEGYNYQEYNVSICNLGAMSGLGNITKIPTSGFTVPKGNDRSVACETGHGYVIKFENGDGSNPTYVRLYVVESIVSTSGGIMGAKVKYQYPFVP
jgi:hypothetical protein